MDPLLRTYAHTAWTPADPLQGLEPEVRRALLIMPSTFRERFRFAPWVDHHQRRQAMVQVLAERRLAYELANPQQQPSPAQQRTESAKPGPFYRERLRRMEVDRRTQDLSDWQSDPRARADLDARAERRERFALLIRESVSQIRERQDELRELTELVHELQDVFGGASRSANKERTMTRSKRLRARDRDRGR